MEKKYLLEEFEKQFLPNGKPDLQILVRFQEEMLLYECAIREVQTKLEILDRDLNIRHGKNSIQSISSRLKSPLSIADKLQRRGLPLSLESFRSIHDIAGLRVICPFIDDIYAIKNMLLKQDDITLLRIKDYIKEPKENGYRSLHLVVKVPVFFSDRKESIPVEVQIRTIAMDFWASLEHKMRYKKDVPDAPAIYKSLKACADVIHQTDEHMMRIRNQIDCAATEMSREQSGDDQ